MVTDIVEKAAYVITTEKVLRTLPDTPRVMKKSTYCIELYQPTPEEVADQCQFEGIQWAWLNNEEFTVSKKDGTQYLCCKLVMNSGVRVPAEFIDMGTGEFYTKSQVSKWEITSNGSFGQFLTLPKSSIKEMEPFMAGTTKDKEFVSQKGDLPF